MDDQNQLWGGCRERTNAVACLLETAKDGACGIESYGQHEEDREQNMAGGVEAVDRPAGSRSCDSRGKK